MDRDEMIALARRMYAAANQHDLAAVDEIFAADFRGVGITGPDQVKRAWSAMIERCPDFHVELVDAMVDGDRMALRATVTGVETAAGDDGYLTEWVRVADGRIADVWGVTNVALR
ncbi:ester cyclase [Actinocatenispora thailandica]|nr:nuclear transport factor 2 family protein [Actinocatenispora thailandica]